MVVNDSLLSRIHCSIFYENNKWNVRDGYIVRDEGTPYHKTSTNGTWMYLSDETRIENGMIFKANHTLFKVFIGY